MDLKTILFLIVGMTLITFSEESDLNSRIKDLFPRMFKKMFGRGASKFIFPLSIPFARPRKHFRLMPKPVFHGFPGMLGYKSLKYSAPPLTYYGHDYQNLNHGYYGLGHGYHTLASLYPFDYDYYGYGNSYHDLSHGFGHLYGGFGHNLGYSPYKSDLQKDVGLSQIHDTHLPFLNTAESMTSYLNSPDIPLSYDDISTKPILFSKDIDLPTSLSHIADESISFPHTSDASSLFLPNIDTSSLFAHSPEKFLSSGIPDKFLLASDIEEKFLATPRVPNKYLSLSDKYATKLFPIVQSPKKPVPFIRISAVSPEIQDKVNRKFRHWFDASVGKLILSDKKYVGTILPEYSPYNGKNSKYIREKVKLDSYRIPTAKLYPSIKSIKKANIKKSVTANSKTTLIPLESVQVKVKKATAAPPTKKSATKV